MPAYQLKISYSLLPAKIHIRSYVFMHKLNERASQKIEIRKLVLVYAKTCL